MTTGCYSQCSDLIQQRLGRSRDEEIAHRGVYLDCAGTPLPCKSMLTAVYEELTACSFANPHSMSFSSSESTHTDTHTGTHTSSVSAICEAREMVLAHFSLSAEEYLVVFTASATAAIKLAGEVVPWSQQSELWVSQNAHTSLLGLRSFAHTTQTTQTTHTAHTAQTTCTTHTTHNAHTAHTAHTALSEQAHTSVKCFFDKELFPSFLVSPTLVDGKRPPDLNDLVSMVTSNPSSEQERESGDDSPLRLIAIPGECNLSGAKLQLSAFSSALTRLKLNAQNTRNWWLLDAAKSAGSSPSMLHELSAEHRPQFVATSFYKIFGYPTGLGALLIRKDILHLLKKSYFGGGTLLAGAADSLFRVPKPCSSAEHFEDGTLNFHAIAAVRHGFRFLDRLGGLSVVSQHTHNLRLFLQQQMFSLFHNEDASSPLCVLFHDLQHSSDISKQGAVIAFNLKYANGSPVSFHEVSKLAKMNNVHIRTGCFCNLGGCQLVLGISAEDVEANYRLGRVCSADHNDVDVINGRNTGLCRVSLGFGTTFLDCEAFIAFLRKEFLNKSPVLPPLHALQPAIKKHNVAEHESEQDQADDEDLFWQREAYSFPFSPTSSDRSSFVASVPSSSSAASSSSATVTAIFIFPVKSCAPVRVNDWPLNRDGLLFDRCFAIVDDKGRVINQKQYPQLALIQPAFALHQEEQKNTAESVRRKHVRFVLQLSCPAMDSVLEVPLSDFTREDDERNEETEEEFRVCGRRLLGKKVSRDADKWISDFLFLASQQKQEQRISDEEAQSTPSYKQFHLVRSTKSSESTTSNNENGKDTREVKSFANTAQYLLLSLASVKALVKMIKESMSDDAIAAVKVENFRPNFVVSVDGDDKDSPHVEDRWAGMRLRLRNAADDSECDLQLAVSGPCSRCSMVNVNGRTGVMDCRVFEALKDYRKLGSSVFFGQFLSFDSLRSIEGKEIQCMDSEGEMFFVSVGDRWSTLDRN